MLCKSDKPSIIIIIINLKCPRGASDPQKLSRPHHRFVHLHHINVLIVGVTPPWQLVSAAWHITQFIRLTGHITNIVLVLPRPPISPLMHPCHISSQICSLMQGDVSAAWHITPFTTLPEISNTVFSLPQPPMAPLMHPCHISSQICSYLVVTHARELVSAAWHITHLPCWLGISLHKLSLLPQPPMSPLMHPCHISSQIWSYLVVTHARELVSAAWHITHLPCWLGISLIKLLLLPQPPRSHGCTPGTSAHRCGSGGGGCCPSC